MTCVCFYLLLLQVEKKKHSNKIKLNFFPATCFFILLLCLGIATSTAVAALKLQHLADSPLAVMALMKTWRDIADTHTTIPTTLMTFRFSSNHHRVEMVRVIISYNTHTRKHATHTHTHMRTHKHKHTSIMHEKC